MTKPKPQRRSAPRKRKAVSPLLKRSPKAGPDDHGTDASISAAAAAAAASATEDLEFERAYSAEAVQRGMAKIAALGAQVREYERRGKRLKREQVKASAAGVAARKQSKAEVERRVLERANQLRSTSKPKRAVAGIIGRELSISSQYVREILKKAKLTSD